MAHRRSPGMTLERRAKALWRQHSEFKWHTARAMKQAQEPAELSLRERSVAAMMRPLQALRGVMSAGATTMPQRSPAPRSTSSSGLGGKSTGAEESFAAGGPLDAGEGDADLGLTPAGTCVVSTQAAAGQAAAGANATAAPERSSAFLSVVTAAAKARGSSALVGDAVSAADAVVPRGAAVRAPGSGPEQLQVGQSFDPGRGSSRVHPAEAHVAMGAEGQALGEGDVGGRRAAASAGFSTEVETVPVSESEFGADDMLDDFCDLDEGRPSLVDRMIGIQAAPFKCALPAPLARAGCDELQLS